MKAPLVFPDSTNGATPLDEPHDIAAEPGKASLLVIGGSSNGDPLGRLDPFLRAR